MLTLSQAAARAGVHVKTLQRLDRVGRLTATGRTATGRRWYAEADIDAFFGISPEQKGPDARPFAYCRVSSAAQKPDLLNQRRILGDFCAARGLVEVCWRLAPEREMVEDLMTIVHCFSSRLYGLRSYKKHLRQSLASHDGSDAP